RERKGSLPDPYFQRWVPFATSIPWAKNFRYFSGAFSGSACTAASMTAPATPCAVRYSPGGTTGTWGGARLPPLQKAATAAQPAGVLNSAASAAGIAARRFSSLGSTTHFSAACTAAAILGGRFEPAAARVQRQAHQTASRFGSAWARKRTASGNCC